MTSQRLRLYVPEFGVSVPVRFSQPERTRRSTRPTLAISTAGLSPPASRGARDGAMIERVPTTVMAVRPFPPDKVATIVNLLTSNPFVNGEVVVLDGGFNATV